jgi:hypothetical protein
MAGQRAWPSVQNIPRVEALADDRVALKTVEILFERAYGRPEQHGDVQVSHQFVIAPQTMALDRWLANKGQPEPTEDNPEPSTDDDDPGAWGPLTPARELR